jgi:serine/threonine-protein kinase
VADPVAPSSDSELRAHVERVLSPHYELDCEIGRGGMGIVYRAKDRRLKRTVAIKVLPPELAFRSEIKTRFLREAETAAQLNHPNIVDIYSVDEAAPPDDPNARLVYFVMAYVSGDNLAKRLHDRGALSIDETRRILRDVADALAYAHERGVIHRDIKPDNILLDAQSGRPMVTDFGIARAVSGDGESRLTATGIAIGTPTYMSPEQAAGERQIDGRSDLYSLGILGYQMLTGEPPFLANSTPAILVKHISERPIPVEQRRRDVPLELGRVIMMLLEKDPANRFPSAAAVVVALDTGALPAIDGVRPTEPTVRLSDPVRFSSTYATPNLDDRTIDGSQLPSANDLRRWNAPEVQKFRRKVAPYLFVNGVIVIASIVGQSDFFGFTVLWSIYMAFKYAKLWSEGYDWRDVFRQSRDRELIDVADETVTSVRSLFDRKQRHALREKRRARLMQRDVQAALPSPSRDHPMDGANDDVLRVAGPYAERVRRAEDDRAHIARLLENMSGGERSRIPDVGRSASALAEKVKMLAISLADLERSAPPSAVESIDAEISRLEGAANPLDGAASEERVRRLAQLRRQRRSLADVVNRRAAIAAKLDTCSLALQNIKFDLMRLRAGTQTHQQITSLAMDALSLADSVDRALFVADEMGRLTESRTSGRSAARPG